MAKLAIVAVRLILRLVPLDEGLGVLRLMAEPGYSWSRVVKPGHIGPYLTHYWTSLASKLSLS